MKLPLILFAIRNHRNVYTGYSPSVLILGKECKRPGDWALTNDGALENIVNSERKMSNIEVMGKLGKDRGTENNCKAHHLSKALQGFHASFAPKWWGPVRLEKRVGKEVFLTDQQPPRKIHVSCLKRAKPISETR